MFRHERPQRGRYRQFHQIGVEVLGLSGPDIDLEVILLTARLWRALGLGGLRLEINSLGDPTERLAYRRQLVDYLEQYAGMLDEDSRNRMRSNPLRVLDSKDHQTRQVVAGAPSLIDRLGEETRGHFERLCQGLDDAGVAYQLNTRLVRGLDYYNRTVFEWITDDLGAQGTVCAGGRYDGLVAQLGGRDTTAIGFAMGIERLVELVELAGHAAEPPLDAYLVAVGERAQQTAPLLAERLRDAAPDLRLMTHCGGGSFKSQFKRADKSGARFALVVGDGELERGVVGVKPLREDAAQTDMHPEQAALYVSERAGDRRDGIPPARATH
jgi:histidyl-tRNA synthetase